MTRHDFSEPEKRLLAERVGYHCSNPACGVSTVGPSANPDEKEYVGVAAHIYSASIDNGPRANPNLTEEQRSNIKNGIHLCNKCSTQIDKNNGRGYPAELLVQWKKYAESRARKRIHQNQPVNLYKLVEFDNLEKRYSTALTCSGLGEKNVLSCPSYKPYIEDITTKLKLAYKCVIRGVSGSGKSLLTYQVAKEFYDKGWVIYKLNKSSLVGGVGIVAPSQKSIVVIDDSQTIDVTQLEDIIECSNEDCIILLNWNSNTSNNGVFLRSYPCVDIVPSQLVEMLKQYCIDNKKQISGLLEGMGISLCDRNYHYLIETRIERASKEKTPWLFNYSLTEGWRVADNDLKLLKDNKRLDLVMIVVAAYQYATLDQGVSEEVIIENLRRYCSSSAWLNNASKALKDYCVLNEGVVKHKHYLYAEEVLKKFIASEKRDSPQLDYVIDLFRRILTNKEVEKGHSNILEFLLFDYKYCHYVFKKDNFIMELAEEVFSEPVTSMPSTIHKLNSLLRSDKSVISIIDKHINIIQDWIVECDKDSAYPISELLNTLFNEKYDNFVITDKTLDSLFDKLLESQLTYKTRFSSLINRVWFFLNETQKETCKTKIDNSGLVIDVSKYPIGEEHYHFSYIIRNLSCFSEEWADKCVHANIESIANNLNKDLLVCYGLYRELLNAYFGVYHWILDIKARKSLKNTTAKKLAKLIKAEAVLSAFKKIDLSKTQDFYTFLIFLKIYNKKLLSEISLIIDYSHLKEIYRKDSKLDHDHRCIIQLLYNTKSKPYNNYVDYVISKNEEIIDLLVSINPTKSLEEMKKGKPYKMRIHDRNEYAFTLKLLKGLDADGESTLAIKIIKDNRSEIQKVIFHKAVNVDNSKEKNKFLVYIYKKTPEILKDIFSSKEDVDELFIKIKRLLKGKANEKNMGRLYMFFAKKFTKSHAANMSAIEARYPSVKKYVI